MMIRKFLYYLVPLMFATIGLAQSASQPGRTGSSYSTQAVAPQDVLATFPAFTATGTTPAVNLTAFPMKYSGTNPALTAVYPTKQHTVQATVTGSPTTCQYSLWGTLKPSFESPVFPTDYVNMSGTKDCTVAAGQLVFITYAPVAQVVIQLTGLTGGTSPTVTFHYLGTH